MDYCETYFYNEGVLDLNKLIKIILFNLLSYK